MWKGGSRRLQTEFVRKRGREALRKEVEECMEVGVRAIMSRLDEEIEKVESLSSDSDEEEVGKPAEGSSELEKSSSCGEEEQTDQEEVRSQKRKGKARSTSKEKVWSKKGKQVEQASSRKKMPTKKSRKGRQ
ncbi:unnamed protein product [Calypogeia fissa]